MTGVDGAEASGSTGTSGANGVRAGVVFDHVILTRFSVRLDASGDFSDEWLAYRWGFFRDALMASLARQTVRDFTWLVFFDAGSPEWLRELVAETAPGLYEPVWLDEPWGHAPLRRAVEEVTSAPWLITTRIDSDDAVSRFFVEDVQRRFDHQESQYVNLLRGVQVDRSGQLYHVSFDNNAFISYVERRIPGAEPRTVFWCMSHPDSNSFAPVLNVVGPVRWMQVVHGSNLANTIRGPVARPERIVDEFDHDLPFATSMSTTRFIRAWLAGTVAQARRWTTHPGFAVQYFRGLRLRLRGTALIPTNPQREARIVVVLRRVWRRLPGRAN